MDNVGLSGKTSKLSPSVIDDIPEALRDNHPIVTSGPKNVGLWVGIAGIVAIALAVIAWLGLKSSPSPVAMPSPQPQESAEVTPTATPNNNSNNNQATNNKLLGHFAYKEAPLTELQPIVPDGSIKLRKAAAQKWKEMFAAAQAEGVNLSVISGFRSIDDQQYLFFDVKAQRGEVATERASVSAPPGYSEHHTGYAIDIGDANVPATNLSPDFENTAAYKWLKNNAAHYSFELSFPKNNPQGVSYEPWHWRFVGDSNSLETFYKAKEFNSQPQK